MRKIVMAIGLVLAVTSASISAEEKVGVGTGMLAQLVGISNLYFQMPLDEESAFVIEYAKISAFDYESDTISGNGVSATYKFYSAEYANSSFWKIGLSSIEVTDGVTDAEGVLPVILWGSERYKENFLYGAELGFGTTGGFGILSLYIGLVF